jgi:hypothetical protein
MSFPVVRRPRPSYGAPPSVEDLPFVLSRDALVTRDPDLIRAGIEAFQGQEQARGIYGETLGPYALPQKMQFQQWKTPPMTGYANRPRHADPYAPAAALMEVRAIQLERERDLIQANGFRHSYPIEHAGFDRRMSDRYAPVDTREVLFRDAPADGHPIPPYPGESTTEVLLNEDEELGPYTQGIQLRMAEIRAQQARLFGLIFSNIEER